MVVSHYPLVLSPTGPHHPTFKPTPKCCAPAYGPLVVLVVRSPSQKVFGIGPCPFSLHPIPLPVPLRHPGTYMASRGSDCTDGEKIGGEIRLRFSLHKKSSTCSTALLFTVAQTISEESPLVICLYVSQCVVLRRSSSLHPLSLDLGESTF